jgi:pimeloyl-ACP methyl ester carboxylesterase
MVHDVPIRDGRMHVRVIGSGTTALFLHGISAHGNSWLEVARILERSQSNLACWIPDLLGRGQSDPGVGLRYRLEDEVRRIQNFAEEFNARSATKNFPSVIIGHSQGAAIALALAASEPSVRGLILSNPITPQIRRPLVLEILNVRIVRHLIARIIARFHQPLGHLILRRAGGPHFRISRDSVAAYSQPYSEVERARTLLRILSDWHPGEICAQLPKRQFVTHVFAGAHDPRVSVDVATRLASDLNAGLTIVEDGGHVLPEQHPKLFARKIAEIATMVDSEL